MSKGFNSLSRYLSRQDALGLLELIHASLSCTGEEDFRELMGALDRIVPHERVISLYAKVDGGGMGGSFDAVNVSYPPEWIDLYVRRQFQRIDPVMRDNFTRFRLQYWADTYRAYDPPRDFIRLAEDFGLREGYTHVVRNLRGTEGSLFSFAGRSVKRSTRTETILKLVVPHLHRAAARIWQRQRLGRPGALTAREREVLAWVGQGKSTWEVSAILGISQRTVKFHVANAMRKLDAVSRPHAVALAVELGLIEIE